MKYTKVDGVMSSEAILEYPALFSGPEIKDMDLLIQEYLSMVEKYPRELEGERNSRKKRGSIGDSHRVKAHLFKFMHSGFENQGHLDLRD